MSRAAALALARRGSRAVPLALALAVAVTAMLAAGPAGAADAIEARDAAFVGRGLVILWAVLKAPDAAASVAVVRILPQDDTIAAYAAEGVEPRSQARREIVAPRRLSAWEEVRIPRAALGEHPRTELHFAGQLPDLLARRPSLTVFYAGLPPATPEVATEAALSAHFANALARARSRPPDPAR